jgi:hypothetical protein
MLGFPLDHDGPIWCTPISIYSDTLCGMSTHEKFYGLLLRKTGNKEDIKGVGTFDYPYTNSPEGLNTGDQEVISIV